MRSRADAGRTITLRTGHGHARHTFRVADRDLNVDANWPHLLTLRRAALSRTGRQPVPRVAQLGPASLVYQGTDRIGGTALRVRCESTSRGMRLQMLPLGRFTIAPDGGAIHADLCNHRLSAAALLGPPLLLALARQGVFALHASAVTVDGKLIAFCGDSGAGKSTLASFFASRANGSNRIADDVLPVTSSEFDVTALPHYPQLKLGRHSQPARTCAERMPLAAVCILGRPSRRLSLRALSALEAALALVRHSMCSRLYDVTTLLDHMGFCTEVAEQVPVYELAYARTRAQLSRVAGAVSAELARISHQDGDRSR